MLARLGLRQPPNRTARTAEQALQLAGDIGYPLVVRPSYVLGGRAMEVVFNEEDLQRYMREAVRVSNDSPVLLDHFLSAAVEVDVDAVCDGTDVLIGGILEHIEQAGVHSGDSACSLPPYTLDEGVQDCLREQMRTMAGALHVVGLMNAQFAIQNGDIFVLEVNPRASRTVPFVSKATGRPLAKIAARCMVGRSLASQQATRERIPPYFSVKEAVFPFIKFPGVDPLLGPEMKSTGEVMGVGRSFGEAFGRAQLGAGEIMPTSGRVFISVRQADRDAAVAVAREFAGHGFPIVATRGTAAAIQAAGIDCEIVNKVTEGRPNIVDLIKNGQIHYIINTTEGKQAIADSFLIRRTALQHKINYSTTVAHAKATSMAFVHSGRIEVNRLQDLHRELAE
jgi:carbamoyl-phosphate synthase large subunit